MLILAMEVFPEMKQDLLEVVTKAGECTWKYGLLITPGISLSLSLHLDNIR